MPLGHVQSCQFSSVKVLVLKKENNRLQGEKSSGQSRISTNQLVTRIFFILFSSLSLECKIKNWGQVVCTDICISIDEDVDVRVYKIYMDIIQDILNVCV